MQVSEKDIKMLRDSLIKANEILNRLGFGLDNENKKVVVKKELTMTQRRRNWEEALLNGKKPKHLQK